MASSGWNRKRTDTAAEQARRAKYNSREHRQARDAIKAARAAGQVLTCWRCGHPILLTDRCVVGHDDHDVNRINGPEHHTCNKRAADRKGALVANRKRAKPTYTPPQYRAPRKPWSPRNNWT